MIMSGHRQLIGLFAALLLAAPAAQATALELQGERFESTIEVDATELRLRGGSTYTYLFWTLYSAVLYLPPAASAEAVLGDTPRRLEIVYHRAIERADLIRAAEAILERNLSVSALARLRAGIDAMHRAYVDVREGDRYSLTYSPASGTELRYNEAPVATVPGAEFAAAYFAIWVGPDPLDASLRDSLLARR